MASGVGQAVPAGQRSPSSGSDKHIPLEDVSVYTPVSETLKAKIYVESYFLFVLYLLVLALIH